MTTEEKNELAQKLVNIEEIASNMWYAGEYPEEGTISTCDFFDEYQSICKEIIDIRKTLGIPQPVETV